MKGQTCFLVAFFTATFLVDVLGYQDGVVGVVCESMLPNHGSNPQTSDAPYRITANTSTFNPGDIIQVTLDGISGGSFEGVLLEARTPSSTIPRGTFRATNPLVQLLTCNVDGTPYPNSAVSHTSNSDKSEIIVNWIAPDVGNIEFRATFVQSFSTFWTGVTSQIIERSGATVVPQITTASSTSSRSRGSSSMPAAGSNVDAFSSDACGSTKFCFINPAQCNPATDQNCFFMSSTPLNNQGLLFEMSGMANGYIAIGFSDDRIMGNDDVYICGMDVNGIIQVQRAYSTGKFLPESRLLGEVDNINVTNNNGIIQCSFVTRNNISTAQRAANNMHYLFFAFGSSSNGRIGKHQRTYISSEKVNVGAVQLISGSSGRPILIKTHGALMLIAWMTTGSIGMMIAHYLKCIGGESKFLGKAWWFQLHFPLMTLTVALTIIGFVLVFVQVKGWSYGAGAHPVLGCIVMGLALIQPFVAIFRPSPDHKRRWIFKYFHAIMANIIRPLAVAALFLGLLLINVAPDKWPVKVLGGFLGWEVLAHILLILLSIFWRKGCSTGKPVIYFYYFLPMCCISLRIKISFPSRSADATWSM
ncbi:putative ferric-chelate reductase 1 isoform X2 [Amblyraja radiata]|uniref:putative ferric-chelate reductase 1 isoform X2 n=1 Tax=Amblyraja radiata TaxID=386614 RepID=UPI0014038884|nr:putative ferric-chelate reductase 1 isoform X2 [Amblyraja radiata]XP_032884757.1 putative ferric-chelate reductase 1 isoform X2 [Amblyraja radiata]XP_032884758.1 putative ferric-chelate reductase 1 isoform X2 [Amblyraja radiata]